MSTKLYQLYKDAEPGCFNAGGSWFSSWNFQGALAYYGQMIDTVKEGDKTTGFAINDQGYGAPPQTHLHYRGFSRRLQPQTITGTLNGAFFLCANATPTNGNVVIYTRLFVYVVDTTGNPFTPELKATLVSIPDESLIGGSAWEQGYTTTLRSRALATAATVSAYTVPNDGREYRLLVEIGGIRKSTKGVSDASPLSYSGAGARNGLRGGDLAQNWSPAPDLTVGTEDIFPQGAPFFEFSANLTFKPSTYYANDEPERAIDMGMSIEVPVPSVVTGLEGYYQWYKYTQDRTIERSISAIFTDGTAPGDHYCDMWAYVSMDPTQDGPPFYASPENPAPPQPTFREQRPLMLSLLRSGSGLAGGSAFFRVYHTAPAVLSVEKAPTTRPVPGDLYITIDNSNQNVYDPDLPGFGPALWHHPDGTLSWADGHFIQSELGVSLANGKFALPDEGNGDLFIYDAVPAMTLLHVVHLEMPDGSMQIRTIGTDFTSFYVALEPDSDGPPIVYRVSETGVIDAKSWTLTKMIGDGLKNFAVSRDGHVLYAANYDDGDIYRHDLVADLPLSPFPSADDDGWDAETLVLSDNTLVVMFDETIWHYAPDGTVLHTFDVPSSSGALDHIVHEAGDEADRFWLWKQKSAVYTFQLVGFDGASSVATVLKEFQLTPSSGLGLVQRSSPQAMWGPPGSCSFLMMMVPKGGPPVLVETPPKMGIRVWSLQVHTTALSAIEVARGEVKSGQVVDYRVRAVGKQNDPAEGELINWFLTGVGTLLTAQSKTDADGWAVAQVLYGLTETGASNVEATLLC